MPATREQVYGAIDSERDHQVERWGDEGHHERDAYLTYMRVYLRKAEEAACKADHHEAMENVRKLTTLGVACMEDHGAPQRGSYPWLRAAGLSPVNLTVREAKELDTLIFRKNCDYPYSQERIDELRAKSESAA